MLKLVPPRPGKSPNWGIRGTYLRVSIDRTSGTPKKAVAEIMRRRFEEAIERGEHPGAKPPAHPLGFAAAALAYVKSGGADRYVEKLAEYFEDTPLSEIDQAAIDEAALKLYPDVTPATRNVCVYTPISAILRYAKVDTKIRRPKGSKGETRTQFLSIDDAFAVIAAARSFDPELALLLTFLLYTGCRLGEALRLSWEDVDTEYRCARIGVTKNGDPRTVLLREDLFAELLAHRGDRRRVFRFVQGGWLKNQLLRAKLQACGLPAPRRHHGKRVPVAHRLSWVNFHSFRHTWASWMRRYGGVDLQGLVATGNWRDARSAARYAHVVPRDEWKRVEQLPAMKRDG